MNNLDRKRLQKAVDLMEEAKFIIEEIRDEEQDKFDNLSQGLQQTEKGEKLEDNAADLGECYDSLDDIINNLLEEHINV